VTVHSTNPSGTQWCNSGPFAVPESVTPLAYPSFIQVSGYSNTIANLTVALTGVAGQVAGIPGQFLLVAPDGTHNLDFLDEAFFAGGATSAGEPDVLRYRRPDAGRPAAHQRQLRSIRR
jgi:hypothetical protein